MRARVAQGQQETLLALASKELAYTEVMRFIDKMENGSDSHEGDILGADLLPPVDQTNEWEEL